MSGNGSPFFPSYGQISNRSFIKRMEQWGWFPAKRKGDWWKMESPLGDHVDVRAPHIKQGNSAHTFNEVLSCMDIDWSTFINPLEAEERVAKTYASFQSAIREVYDFAKKQERTEEEIAQRREEKRKRKHDERLAQDATQSQSISGLTPGGTCRQAVPEPIKEEPVARKKRATKIYTQTDYFDTLKTLGEASAKDVASILEIDTSDKSQVQRVYSAFNVLSRKGKIERIGGGKWRAVPPTPSADLAPADAKDEIEEMKHPDPAPKPMDVDNPAVEETKAEPGVRVLQREPTKVDLKVEDIADLMFPDGFKAKHISLVSEWMNITRDLIREVNGGTGTR